MAEPPAPHDIARHTFGVVRRGYDQQDVRAYLHEVSSLVERLQRAERELRERAERAEARVKMVEHPDESTMLELLGEETTRVLTSAKEAAADIRAKAEASAEQLIADATAEAATTRSAAVADADATRAQAKAESEAVLAEARTELERRSQEAQEAAERIREEAAASVETLREDGRRELAAAREEAEAAIEAAKAEGKSMVVEAQTVRERVLRDLQVRRKKARLQVEKLNAGRERLLQAYDVVRRTIDEATDELTVSLSDARILADAAARRLEDEPEPTLEQLDAEVSTAGLVDLPIADIDDEHHDEDSPGPFSGEVPTVDPPPVEDHPVAEEPAAEEPAAAGGEGEAAPAAVTTITSERRNRRARRKKGFEGLPTAELDRIDPAGADEGVRIVAAETAEAEAEPDDASNQAPDDDAAATMPEAEPDTPAEVGSEADADIERDAAAPAADSAPDSDPDAGESDAVVAEAPGDAPTPAKADDVFARLRAEQVDAPQDDAEAATEAADLAEEPVAADADEPAPEAAAFTARADALRPVEKELARRLKRSLADEQNEVLDQLRRAKPKGIDDLLPSADDHAARWAESAAAALGDAASAGATWAGGTASSVLDLADELARGLTGPLRDRIDRSFAASDGNLDDVADRVRALYREWKGQRLAETSQHFAAAAYARGAFEAVDTGSAVRWVVDPSTAPCPDCDDNVLAGAIAKGDDFPTGTPCAPAHTGCRCLVVPA